MARCQARVQLILHTLLLAAEAAVPEDFNNNPTTLPAGEPITAHAFV